MSFSVVRYTEIDGEDEGLGTYPTLEEAKAYAAAYARGEGVNTEVVNDETGNVFTVYP